MGGSLGAPSHLHVGHPGGLRVTRGLTPMSEGGLVLRRCPSPTMRARCCRTAAAVCRPDELAEITGRGHVGTRCVPQELLAELVEGGASELDERRGPGRPPRTDG